jgi:hypothetical protein
VVTTVSTATDFHSQQFYLRFIAPLFHLFLLFFFFLLFSSSFRPRSIEQYVQEVGRAGRDGKPARCVALLDATDAKRHHSLSHRDDASRAQVRRFRGSGQAVREGKRRKEGLLLKSKINYYLMRALYFFLAVLYSCGVASFVYFLFVFTLFLSLSLSLCFCLERCALSAGAGAAPPRLWPLGSRRRFGGGRVAFFRRSGSFWAAPRYGVPPLQLTAAPRVHPPLLGARPTPLSAHYTVPT